MNMKKQISLILALSLVLMTLAIDGFATDVLVHEVSPAMEKLITANVVRGRATDNGVDYGASSNLNRAEFAVMLTRIVGAELNAPISSGFEDMKNHWADTAVSYCVACGLMNGVGSGLFAPNETLTGYQALAVLLRLSGKDAGRTTGFDWMLGTIVSAYELGLEYELDELCKAITRDEVAQMVCAVGLV